MIDHPVLFAVRDDASVEDVDDLLSCLRALRDGVPNVEDLSVGEDLSGQGGGYAHGLVARFRTREDPRSCLDHPDHRAVVGKLDATITGRFVLDHEP